MTLAPNPPSVAPKSVCDVSLPDVSPPLNGSGAMSRTLGRSPCADANSRSASDARSLTDRGMSLADRHSETMPNALATSSSQRCSSAAVCARNGFAKLL